MKLALGTAQFGLDYGLSNKTGKVALDEASSLIEYARNNGITLLDTAFAYGDSEKILGAIGADDWLVVTKLPSIKELNRSVKSAVQESLNRLKLEKIYAILLHRPEDLIGVYGKQLYQDLYQLKQEGSIKKIGLSIYSPVILDKIIPNYDIDIIQAPFNILDKRLLESGWLPKLKKINVEVHVRSIFLQGLLLMNLQERPVTFNKWNNIWSEWDRYVANSSKTRAELCLQWALSFEDIDKIIIGIDSKTQLEYLLDFYSEECDLPDLNLKCNDDLLLDPFNWNV